MTTGGVSLGMPSDRMRRLGRGMRGSRWRVAITSLVFTPLCLLWIYPFLWVVSSAFKTDNEIFASLGLLPKSPQWSNFSRAWNQAHIGRYFLNTAVVAVSAVAIVVVTTAMMGYVLGRYSFPGKRVIVAFFAATIFIPEGYTVIPIFDLINRLHLNNNLLGLILAESGGAHIIYILLFAGFFAQLPRELEEAAIMDGAGFFRVFAQVMLPLAKPVIATTIILQFIRSWNDFFLPLVLTLSHPELRTLGVGIFAFQGENFNDWSGMAAAATIALLPIVAVFLLLQRYFVEGIAGAVKQ